MLKIFQRLPMIAVVTLALGVARTGFSLDNTQSNDYWCTWGYVNVAPVPVESSEMDVDCFSASAAPDECEAFDSVSFWSVWELFDFTFRSTPPKGMFFFIR